MFIPKPDGRLRPLGVAALEDKILQRAVVEVLNAIYEEDFLGFSYGFRPGRRPHDALDALAVAIDAQEGELGARRGHPRLLHPARSGLAGAVPRAPDRGQEGPAADPEMAQGRGHRGRGMVGDGGGDGAREHRSRRCSANVYLHYVFDLWADQWRRRHARGDVILVRFADDFVAGFEHREDAERFLADLRERFAEFGLELHPEKTRLIEFGRFAAERPSSARRLRSLRRSSSWASRTSARRTGTDGSSSSGSRARRRCAPSCTQVKTEMQRRMHLPIPEQGRWLASVLDGHYNYYAVPDNSEALRAFRRQGHLALAAGAHGAAASEASMTWERMRPPRRPMATPTPHPPSLARRALRRQNPREEPSALDAHAGICAGGRRQRRSLPRLFRQMVVRPLILSGRFP